MAQFLFLCITASVLMVKTGSQAQISNILNPDQIYFEDNKPSMANHINRPIQSNIDLQPPYNRPNEAQLPILRPNRDQRPINNLNVPQFTTQRPINNLNVPQFTTQRPINNLNVPQFTTQLPLNLNQIPVNGFNIGPQQVNDPDVVQRHSEEDIKDGKDIGFDQSAAALTNFSLNVMRNVIGQRQGNTVVSPYSIASLLSLLQQGAVEQSLDQISRALQMTPQVAVAFYKNYRQSIQSRNSRNTFISGNNLFVADGFSLNPRFREIAVKDFDSAVTSTNFGLPELAAQFINDWVASKTNKKINNLVTPESIAIDTQMVLVNAVYFKGLWDIPFRPHVTKPDAFQLRTGAIKAVPFMSTRRYFRAGIDAYTDSRVVILPFEREEYSLMIILPSKLSSADDVLRTLTVPLLENYLNMRPVEVALEIPKFTIKANTNLSPVLKQMGVTNIFEQRSGLAGIGMYQTIVPQVSSAVHSAVLSIDEEGGMAAAASAFAVVALSNDEPSMKLKVDRPFITVLWDAKTKLPLFIAKVEDPSL